MTNPFRKAQTLISKLVRGTLGLAEPTTIDRAIGMSALTNQVYDLIENMTFDTDEATEDPETRQYPYIMDLFHGDDGGMFAVVAYEGRLYRVDLTVSGADVSAADPVQVVQEFPAAERTLKIVRQADGSYRGFLISSVTVLNRVGEIDSTTLHDNLNRRATESGHYPYIDFVHLGPNFHMGQVDYLARDEAVAIASFIFDDTPLGRAMIAAYTADPDYWGASISYHPLGTIERMKVGEIEIPVFTDGEYDAITICPEHIAASPFTALRSNKETNRMNKAVLEALTKLAGGDDDALAAFVTQVDETNRTIQERDLIRRTPEGVIPAADAAADPAAVTEPVTPPAGEETPETETDAEAPTLVLDDAAIGAIASSPVVASLIQHAIATATKPLTDQITALQSQLVTADTALRTIREAEVARDERLAALEKSDSEKQRNWTADLGKNALRETHVTYRARETERTTPLTAAEIAADTLAQIQGAHK